MTTEQSNQLQAIYEKLITTTDNDKLFDALYILHYTGYYGNIAWHEISWLYSSDGSYNTTKIDYSPTETKTFNDNYISVNISNHTVSIVFKKDVKLIKHDSTIINYKAGDTYINERLASYFPNILLF